MTLLDFVSQDVSLKRVSSTSGGEYAGPCPVCGGTDRFHIWPEAGNYWCRQCQKKGDTIQYLRDVRGLSFRDAARMVGRDLDAMPNSAQQRRRELRERLLQEYRDWGRQQDRAEADRYGDVWREIEIAEIVYRVSAKRPDWFTDEEADYWATYLGDLYDAGALAEESMADEQSVSPEEQERQRFQQWQEERHV